MQSSYTENLAVVRKTGESAIGEYIDHAAGWFYADSRIYTWGKKDAEWHLINVNIDGTDLHGLKLTLPESDAKEGLDVSVSIEGICLAADGSSYALLEERYTAAEESESDVAAYPAEQLFTICKISDDGILTPLMNVPVDTSGSKQAAFVIENSFYCVAGDEFQIGLQIFAEGSDHAYQALEAQVLRVKDSGCVPVVTLEGEDASFDGVTAMSVISGDQLYVLKNTQGNDAASANVFGIVEYDTSRTDAAKSIPHSFSALLNTRMRELALKCTVVEVYVRDVDLNGFIRQCKIPSPTCASLEIARTAFELFRANYPWSKPLRSIGVRGAGLVPADSCIQLSLDGDEEYRERLQRLDRSVDELRRRYGSFFVISQGVCNKMVDLCNEF